MAQPTDSAVLAAGLESEDAEGLGHDHLLHFVVRGRDALEDLKSLESGSAAGCLVGNHATDGLVKDTGRGAEVERAWEQQSVPSVRSCELFAGFELTAASRVVPGHLPEIGVVLDCTQLSVFMSRHFVSCHW